MTVGGSKITGGHIDMGSEPGGQWDDSSTTGLTNRHPPPVGGV